MDFSQYLFDKVEPSEAVLSVSDNTLAKPIDIKDELKDLIKDQKAIFITINPDPEKDINRRKFKILISKWRKYIKKIFGEDSILYYRFERSTVAKLHVHGVIYNINECYSKYPYEGLFIKVQKYIHKDIGRKKVKHTVCCDMQWAGNYQSVIDYIFKNKK